MMRWWGCKNRGVKYSVEADRRKAIALAIEEARPGDIVLLAGKGHEKVQVTREGAVPFDDLEVAREALRAAGFECKSAQAGARRMRLTLAKVAEFISAEGDFAARR